jgi:hypothetical protein
MNSLEKGKFVVTSILNPRTLSYFYKVLKEAASELKHNELLNILNSVSSDKGKPGHNYARIYNYYLRDKREQIESICEIGLLRHSLQTEGESATYNVTPSLYVWEQYFPRAEIVGFDIRSFTKPASNRVKILRGDQSKRDDLQQITAVKDSYDIIIDDALHASRHQQLSFSFLFKYVKKGGIFFIEDINNQPQKEHESDDIPTTRSLLRTLQEKDSGSHRLRLLMSGST